VTFHKRSCVSENRKAPRIRIVVQITKGFS